MFLHDVIGIGDTVRCVDGRHEGKVIAMFGTATWMAQATFRVKWRNGWLEDLKYDEIEKVW